MKKKTVNKFKSRMRLTPVDVGFLVRDLRAELVGKRVSTVYDCIATPFSPKSIALRISTGNAAAVAQSDALDDGDDSAAVGRNLLVVDAPARMHLTAIARPRKTGSPSNLIMQCRKYLRGRRISEVFQLGCDRVIVIKVGANENANHLVVELYAQGNIFLCDADMMVITALKKRKLQAPAAEEGAPAEKTSPFAHGLYKELPEVESVTVEYLKGLVDTLPIADVRDLLRNVCDFGAHMQEHIVAGAGFAEITSLTKDNKDEVPQEKWEALREHICKALALFKSLACGDLDESYMKYSPAVLLKPAEAEPKSSLPNISPLNDTERRYFDFVPVPFADTEGVERIEYPTFDCAVDEFFSKMELAQVDNERKNMEAQMIKKKEKFEREQTERLQSLEGQAEALRYNAMLIEYNLPLVDRIMSELKTIIASGMPWTQIEQVIKTMKVSNPGSIAMFIDKLDLAHNKVYVLLAEPNDYDEDEEEEEEEDVDEMEDEDEEDEEKEMTISRVEIDLELNSAHANIKKCYDQRDVFLSKAKKMGEVSDEVRKKVEKKHMKDMKAAIEKKAVASASLFNKMRKRFWFEKFNWFISSEGFVVISGRDMQQNEMLFRRYMKPNDIYVHADVHGAATCLIKNPSNVPIGASTLEQAGRHAMSHSAAWASKTITSAWWVRPNQVSKSAPSGEYLTTGSFMIRGKKNYLPPRDLTMGFGFLFLIDDASVQERRENGLKGSFIHPTEKDDLTASGSVSVFTESSEIEALASSVSAVVADDDDWESMAESKIDDEAEVEATPAFFIPPAGDLFPASAKTLNFKTEPEEEEEKPPVVEEMKDDEEEKEEAPAVAVPEAPAEEEKDLFEQHEEDQKLRNKKVRMSAKQRREMKKRQQLGLNPDDELPEERKPQPAKPKQKPVEAPKPQPKQKKLSKAKARKYRDQDDEDRELAMIALGHAPKEVPKPAEEKKEDEKPKQACFICGSTDHYARNCPKKPKEEPKPEQVEEDDEDAAISAANMEKAIITSLEKLVAMPKPTDTILFALPVCAPWESIQSFKYKIKLTPGHLKRSKAVANVLQVFLKQKDMTEQEKKAIQAVPNDELLQTMMSDVTVAGGQAAARIQKGKGKKK